MTSLIIPDVNVWMALAVREHEHYKNALAWWSGCEGKIGFIRVTQLSMLRLLTTSAAMGGKPQSTNQAWATYHKFFNDERVVFLQEPFAVELEFQRCAKGNKTEPKLWQDSWLLAFATAADGVILTFDRGLAKRSSLCRLLVE